MSIADSIIEFLGDLLFQFHNYRVGGLIGVWLEERRKKKADLRKQD